ncbi:MAG: hypothetical protein IRZ28_12345 [Steroidobacteraceae bacterium]|nr:hypothetical protein [Steroidobacteraceae bacterium]
MHAVPDSARTVVTEVAIEEQLPIEAAGKLTQGRRFNGRRRTVQFHGADLGRHHAGGRYALTERHSTG